MNALRLFNVTIYAFFAAAFLWFAHAWWYLADGVSGIIGLHPLLSLPLAALSAGVSAWYACLRPGKRP